jgi:hypothetical protein
MRKKRNFQLLLATILGLIAACTPPTPPPVATAQTVSGTIAQWSSTSSGTLKAYFAKDQAAAASASVASSGAFSLELPVVSGSALTDGVGKLLRGCASPAVTANPADLKLSNLVLWAVEHSNLFAGEAIPSKTGGAVAWIFSDKASAVSGTENCLGMTSKGDAVYTYNLSLALGWNAYQITKTADKAFTLSSIGLTEALTWVLNAYQDVAGLAGGTADTNTVASLKGSLPNLDVNQWLLEISKGNSSETTRLGSVVSQTGNDFNLALPASVSADALGLVSDFIAVSTDCTNSATLSDTTTKYGVLKASLAKNGTSVYEAKLRNYAHQVQWWYVDKPAVIDGFQTCNDRVTPIQKFQLNLQTGWNFVTISLEQFGAVQLFKTATPPAESRWFPELLRQPTPIPPNGFQIAGSSIGGWNISDVGLVRALVKVTDPVFISRPIETADLKNGSFNLFLPFNMDSNLIPIEFKGVCSKAEVNPTNSLGTFLSFEARVGGIQVGLLRPSNNGNKLLYFYANAATQVSGTQTCTDAGVNYTETYQISLIEGWNVIQYQQLEDSATVKRVEVSNVTPNTVSWTLEPTTNTVGLDAGSTNTSLKGNFAPSTTFNQKMRALVFAEDPNAQPLDVGIATISNTGAFTLNLTNNPDPSVLFELNFDDPSCVSSIVYSNPAAVGTPIELTIEDSNGAYISSPRPTVVDNVASERIEFNWWYLDASANVTGSQTCTDPDTGEKFKASFFLNLQAGWNIIGATNKIGTGEYILRSYSSVPSQLRWFTEKDEIEVPNAK